MAAPSVRSAVGAVLCGVGRSESGRSRDDATACVAATRRAGGRTIERSCQRLPTRHGCRDPGAPRATTDAPRSHASGHRSPVTARKGPIHQLRQPMLPKKGPLRYRVMYGEAPFSTRNRRAEGPDRGGFRGQVSGMSPGIFPPKFRPSSIGPQERHPHLARGRSANDRTRNGPRRSHLRNHVCQLPT